MAWKAASSRDLIGSWKAWEGKFPRNHSMTGMTKFVALTLVGQRAVTVFALVKNRISTSLRIYSVRSKTFESLETISSICSSRIIRGGDSATMSPVTRINIPSS